MEYLQPESKGALPSAKAPPWSSPEFQSYYPPSDPDDGPDAGGLLDYWRILSRHKAAVIVSAFLGVIAAIMVSLPQTPVYRARTAVEIQDINNDFLNSRQVSPVAESASPDNILTDIQTQMRILQSENLVDQVIDDMKAAQKLGPLTPTAKPHSRFPFLAQALKLPPPTAASLDRKMRKQVMNSLTVKQLGQTRVIEVLFDSTDPRFAADFANTLAAKFIDSKLEARWKMSQQTGEWLARQLDDMRIKLERSEDALEAYARKAGLLFMATNTNEKANVADEKLRQVQQELSKAQADRVAAQSRYEIARSASPDALAEVLNDQSLRALQQRLTELRQQQADLASVFTPKHEKVKRVEAQIAPLEQAVARVRSDLVDRIRNDYDSAQRREKLLLADYADQSKVVTEQAEKSIQYNILKREVDSNRQLYESMLQQVKQASVASAMRASNVRIVDPAKVPYEQFSPDYLVNSFVGLLLGSVFGIVLVVAREKSDKTIQQPGELPMWLNIPELGVIPKGQDARNRIGYASRKLLNGAPKNGGDLPLAKGSEDMALVVYHCKPSLMAESFRAVLTSILFSGENGSRPRVLMFTSASPSEGKTTVVTNLAIAVAEIRRKVLIIDADLRRPRVHTLFEIPNDRGLSTLLEKSAVTLETLASTLQATAIPDLFVLPSGPSTHAAANLLYSPVLPDILKMLRGQFDTILIDTPPMLQITDARIIGRMADAVLLVARAGKTTRDAAMAAHQRFAEDKTRMLGAILNDWDPKMSPNGYYGNYKGDYKNTYTTS